MRTIVRSEKFAETDCIYWEESFYLIQLRLRGLSMTPLTPMHRSSKQKINKETQVLNDTLDEISLISSGHSIQMQKNTPSSQVHMEHSPGEPTSWVTNQTSVNLRKLKSYQTSYPTTMLWDWISITNNNNRKKNCKKHKHMEIK